MIEGHRKQATLHDVARLANVSHQTVSRVINDSPNLAEETRLRVREAIEALNYRPNRAARSLITGRSQTIQVVDFSATYLTPIPAIVNEATELGYRIGVSILRDEHTRLDLRDLLDDLTSRLVDGLLFFAVNDELDSVELDRLCRGVPYVQLGGNPIAGTAGVLTDHAAGMSLVMDHLISAGHRRIAELSGPLYFYDARIRHQTYLKKMEEARLGAGSFLEGDFSAETAHGLACQLVESGQDFSAIVCANDDTALGTIRALHACGIRVPEDVSVTGFDDHPPVRFYEPPLTTVRQDYGLMSRESLRLLVQMIQNPGVARSQTILAPTLIVRESTRPAA